MRILNWTKVHKHLWALKLSNSFKMDSRTLHFKKMKYHIVCSGGGKHSFAIESPEGIIWFDTSSSSSPLQIIFEWGI